MTPRSVEQRLRLLCRAFALVMVIGAVVELWLVDHTGGALQLLPFGLCAVVLGSVLLVGFRTTRAVVRGHRLIMLLVVLGGVYGVYAHLSHNMTFAREIRPSADAREIWIAGVRGANPLLASGVLMMAAVLGLTGTYGIAVRDG